MKYQNYIFQSLIYLLATIFILLTIGKDANLTDFYWTRITVFVVMTVNALLGIIGKSHIHYIVYYILYNKVNNCKLK